MSLSVPGDFMLQLHQEEERMRMKAVDGGGNNTPFNHSHIPLKE